MKCPNCGKTIGIEVLKCPSCGYTNPLAKKHKENIQKYDQSFKKTQKDVIGAAQKTEKTGVRGGIFAILVAVIIVLVFVWGAVAASYEEETDEDRKNDAIKHKDEYSAQMKEYLDEGDYVTFVSFVRSHNIPFDKDPYEDYKTLFYIADDYCDSVRYWEEVIFRPEDPDYYDHPEMNISHLCSHIESFAMSYENKKQDPKNEEIIPYMDDMYSDFRAMLRKYLKMTDSEVDEFLTYSDTKMAVVVEEILLGEVSEDE